MTVLLYRFLFCARMAINGVLIEIFIEDWLYWYKVRAAKST